MTASGGPTTRRGGSTHHVAERRPATCPRRLEPVREALLFSLVDEARRAALARSRLDVAESGPEIRGPAGLGELAVLDDVDTHLCLGADHLGNRAGDALLEQGRVVSLPQLAGGDHVLQIQGFDQAADVRGQDALGAALHSCPPLPMQLYNPRP